MKPERSKKCEQDGIDRQPQADSDDEAWQCLCVALPAAKRQACVEYMFATALTAKPMPEASTSGQSNSQISSDISAYCKPVAKPPTKPKLKRLRNEIFLLTGADSGALMAPFVALP